jgi:hypothetical protein
MSGLPCVFLPHRGIAVVIGTVRTIVAVFLLVVCMGAQRHSDNFVVDADDADVAEEVSRVAERLRRDLAVEWLGAAMPNWPHPCTVTVQVGQTLEPGGATTSVYDRGEAFVWRMTIRGPVERIYDCVLPHEITHAIFASHFRRQLPRWADEGGATNVELACQKAKYRDMLLRCLRSDRRIPFDRMFAMTEYPADMMPLYTQGFSLAEFLIQHGGRRKFVEFLDAGLSSGQWSAETQSRYAFADLGELQNAWSAWLVASVGVRRSSNVTASIASRSPRPSAVDQSR